jgi:RNA polymerase sigma-70 factor (ECF subfamily)
MKAEESAIIELFQRDKEAAFERMFRRYFSPLCIMASYFTEELSEAEDLVQQIFIRFWSENWQERIHTSLESFLKTSVKNSCINYLEKQITLSRKIQNLPCEEMAGQAFDFLVDENQMMVVETVLSQLPPKGRQAFELVYLEDESYASAADQMSISVNTLKSHLKSTLDALRKNKGLHAYYEGKKNQN